MRSSRGPIRLVLRGQFARPSQSDIPGQGTGRMLWIHADRYGLDPTERRHTFKAMSFTHSLSADGRTGTITLHPQETLLCVGSGAEDYKCVRIFSENGGVVGTMRRSPAGEVTWHRSIAVVR